MAGHQAARPEITGSNPVSFTNSVRAVYLPLSSRRLHAGDAPAGECQDLHGHDISTCRCSRAPPLGDRVNTRRFSTGAFRPAGTGQPSITQASLRDCLLPVEKSPSVDSFATGGALDTIGLFWTAYCNYRLLNLPWRIVTGTDRRRLWTETASVYWRHPAPPQRLPPR